MASLKQGQYTHASLEATFGPEIARSWTNINFDSNYIEALGRHSAVKFGPRRIISLKGDIEGRKEVFAIGLLHSTVRKAQADRLFARENGFQRRGVVVNIPEIPQAVMNLAQIKFDKRAFYYYARCEECSAEFLGQDKRPHKRLANKNTDKKCFTIARNFFYPHDLFT
ncbi:hypothetical protein BGZ89_009560 [Linnemannia elongata]|nr:hypothetical protein BGZ89_009560 [Linnemannia elongata]